MSKIETRLQPKLKAKKINYKLPGDLANYYSGVLGYMPFIWYNGYHIDLKDVEYFELSFMDGIPSMKMTFNDSLNIMRDQGFPLDDTKISLFIHPRTTQLQPIHIDFKIIDFKFFEKTFTCVGLLDVNKLYVKEFKSYKDLTSYQLLYKISQEIGLGFKTNVQNSNDKMTWINTGDKISDFLEKIIDNSYLNDQSFMMGFIDYTYSFNYIDVEKELKRDIKQDLAVQNTGVEKIIKTNNSENLSPLILTNDRGMAESNFYFEKYTVLNKSTTVAIQQGYKSIIKYYNQLTKEYLSFNLDSITDNTSTKIVLKGAPKDSSFKNDNSNYLYKGKLDTDNMHINYTYAKIHNDRNLLDLEKIGLEIELPTPNFNLHKLQKVQILISNNSHNVQQAHINSRLSGEWLIIDMKYRYQEQVFKQVVTLVKRELELSKSESR